MVLTVNTVRGEATPTSSLTTKSIGKGKCGNDDSVDGNSARSSSCKSTRFEDDNNESVIEGSVYEKIVLKTSSSKISTDDSTTQNFTQGLSSRCSSMSPSTVKDALKKNLSSWSSQDAECNPKIKAKENAQETITKGKIPNVELSDAATSFSSTSTISTKFNSVLSEATNKAVVILSNGGKLEDASTEMDRILSNSSHWSPSKGLGTVATRAAALVLNATNNSGYPRVVSLHSNNEQFVEPEVINMESIAVKAASVAMEYPQSYGNHEFLTKNKHISDSFRIPKTKPRKNESLTMHNEDLETAAAKAAMLVLTSKNTALSGGIKKDVESLLSPSSKRSIKSKLFSASPLSSSRKSTSKRNSLKQPMKDARSTTSMSVGSTMCDTLDFEAASKSAMLVLAAGGSEQDAFKSAEKVFANSELCGFIDDGEQNENNRGCLYDSVAMKAAVSVLSDDNPKTMEKVLMQISPKDVQKDLVSVNSANTSRKSVGNKSKTTKKTLDDHLLASKSKDTQSKTRDSKSKASSKHKLSQKSGATSVSSQTSCSCGSTHSKFNAAARAAVDAIAEGKTIIDAVKKIEKMVLPDKKSSVRGKYKSKFAAPLCVEEKDKNENDVLSAAKAAVLIFASGGTRAEACEGFYALISSPKNDNNYCESINIEKESNERAINAAASVIRSRKNSVGKDDIVSLPSTADGKSACFGSVSSYKDSTTSKGSDKLSVRLKKLSTKDSNKSVSEDVDQDQRKSVKSIRSKNTCTKSTRSKSTRAKSVCSKSSLSVSEPIPPLLTAVSTVTRGYIENTATEDDVEVCLL